MSAMKVSLLVLVILFCNGSSLNTTKILSDAFIEAINIKATWTAGRNFHEGSSLKNLFSVFPDRSFKLSSGRSGAVKDLPVHFDSREKWKKCHSIKDITAQGNCASAWAVVVSSVFRDRYCIANGSNAHVSSRYLMSCCAECGQGCFGGYVDRAIQYLESHGLPSGGPSKGCVPYGIRPCPTFNGSISCPKIREQTGWCYERRCARGKLSTNMLKKTRSSFSLSGDEKKIQSEIFTNGPVIGVLSVYEDFVNYKSGVYDHVDGRKVGRQEVKIIGWGVDKKTRRKYWLIVNSWGNVWGESGLVKVVRGSNECDLEDNVFSFLV